MLKHYLITILRFSSRNKFNFSLNIVGLIIGLACSFTLLNYILYEFGYDQMHANKKNIYRIDSNLKDHGWKLSYTPYILNSYLKVIPEIKNTVTIGRVSNANLILNEESFPLSNLQTANEEIFKIFSFQFIRGDSKNALSNYNSLVVGREFVKEYFHGNFDLIGSSVDIQISDEVYTFIITGIIDDLTEQSSERLQLIANIDFNKQKTSNDTSSPNDEALWSNNIYRTYVLTEDKANIRSIEKKINNIVKKECENLNTEYSFQPLLKIHLFSSNFNNANSKGISKIFLFLLIGICTFLVSSANFTLFSLGQHSLRTKEFGVKKVFGATKSDSVSEYLIESLFICAISFPLAIVISNVLSHETSKAFGTLFYFNVWSNPGLISIFLLLSILMAFLGGMIYSIKISGKDPYSILIQDSFAKSKKFPFSMVLISIQIAIFTGLLSGSQIIYAQLQNEIKMDKGFDDKNLILFSLGRNSEIPSYSAFKEDILNNSHIQGITGGANLPPSLSSAKSKLVLPGVPGTNLFPGSLFADKDLASVLQLKMTKGRWFSEEFSTDKEKLIVNHQLLKELDIQDSSYDFLLSQNIIGVTEDFTLVGAKEPIQAMRIVLNPELHNRNFMVRCEIEKLPEIKNHIHGVIDKYELSLDSDIELFQDFIKGKAYKEIQMLKVIILFGIITVILAMLGLFGHSVFVAKNKIFHGGMRKVFGARKSEILLFYLKDFLTPFISANILSSLIVYYIMLNWLNNYSFHIRPDVRYFLLSAIFSAIIVFISVVYNFRYLYRLDAVEVLRHE